MYKFTLLLYILVLLAAIPQYSLGQDSVMRLSEGYLSTIQTKMHYMEDKLTQQSDRILKKMLQQEEKLWRKLARKDSLKAQLELEESKQKYAQLKTQLNNPLSKTSIPYSPYLDTLRTSLKFLNKESGIVASGKQLLPADISKTIGAVDQLENQLQQSERLKAFLQERQRVLQQQFGEIGMVKELKKMNKALYYYAAQLKEYKTYLSDPKKMEQHALLLLRELPLFKKFMQEHSQLASMFGLSGANRGVVDPGSLASLQGLQTRSMVQQQLQQQFGSTAGSAVLQQNMQQAQSQLSDLKSKLLRLGGVEAGELTVPNFKPNTQKTKSFKERLELGSNIQSQKAIGYLPSASELGLSLGYRLNDNSTIGIGASYKWAWGAPLKDIRITHEGVGLRSFIDYRLKGHFYISGGYEQNYIDRFNRVAQLKNTSAWQQSGLLGVSKQYGAGKFSGKLSLLWDFLSYGQVPRSQALKFRVAYNF